MSALLVLSVIYVGVPAGITGADAQQPGKAANIPPDLISSIINSGKAPSPDNFNVAKGFKIEPLLWNTSFPSSVTFDDKNHMFIAESGKAFGGARGFPRILQADMQSGAISVVTDRFLSMPITYITYHNGTIYAANGSKVSKIDPKTGIVTNLISGFPVGDHAVDQITFGPDGRMYVAVGSATNSGVVGVDNYLPSIGWLASFPMTHDVPGKNVTLTGQNFQTPNVLADGKKVINATKDMNEVKVTVVSQNNGTLGGGKGTAAVMSNMTGNVTTGAFMAFGNQTQKGQVIQGNAKCTACIISAKPDGTDLKVAAWGLRLDIYSGITFDKSGKNLIVADSGDEERGSRPIKGDHDKIWKIDVSKDSGKWYGWPDFALGNGTDKKLQPVTDPQFHSPRSAQPLQRLTQGLTPASGVFADPGYAVKMTQAALAPNQGGLGLSGMVVMGEYGTHAPTTHAFGKDVVQYTDGKASGTKIIGQKVVMLNTTSGNLTDFVSLKKPDPSFRPVGVAFSPSGNDLYIVSLGKVEHRTTLPNGASLPTTQIWPYTNTGVIWRVSRAGSGQSSEVPSKFTLAPGELTAGANIGPAPKSDDIQLPQGYKAEPLLWNLDLPGATTFDDKGNMYILEVGFIYNGLTPPTGIIKVDHQTGNVSVFVDRGLDWPATYITFHNGQLYVTNGGRVSTIDMQGRLSNIIEALPGIGDHYADQIAFGPDNRMYFGIGTATNSGIIGRDDPWVMATPNFHDIPGKNVTLAGVNFTTPNFYTAEKNDNATTGTNVPFGTATTNGQVIKGDTKCTGCVLSARPDGTDLRLVGWGFRHPYGSAFAPDGKLIVTMNAADERGSRPIANDGDKAYIIDVANSSSLGQFYGWPDFFGNGEPVTEKKFTSSEERKPLAPLFQNDPPAVKPAHVFDVGAAVTHVDFSNSSKFGYEGKAFIGEFGTLAPQTHLSAVPNGRSPGAVMGQVIGQKVITFDPKTAETGVFMSLKTADPYFHPVDVKFSPGGDTLYVISVGRNEVRTLTPNGGVLPFTYGQPWGYAYTGVLWKITHSGGGSNPNNNNNVTAAASDNNNSSIEKTIIQGLTIGSSSGNATTSSAANATAGSLQIQPSANVTIVRGAALKRDQAFQPSPVTVKINGTVTWVNKDDVVHTVTSGDEFSSPDMGKQFDSGMLGGVYSHMFNTAGTYDYFCQIHPTMRGKVIVR